MSTRSPSEPAAQLDAVPHPLRVLYLGDDRVGSNDLLRVESFRRLAHSVRLVNPTTFVPANRIWTAFDYRTGYRFSRRHVGRRVLEAIADETYDLVWVSGGASVDGQLVRALKPHARVVINQNLDDPYGGRDGRRWDTFLNAIPEYDAMFVLRAPNVDEAANHGAKRITRVWHTYDDLAHQPAAGTEPDDDAWSSDVAFIGTWMPERGRLVAELMQRGVPVALYGMHWHKAPEWDTIRPAWRGNVAWGANYARAVRSAKICIGLVSKGNRDEHTTRSLEVPAIGSLLCAERTPEHAELYVDGEQAIFWGDPTECAERCLELLADDHRRRAIAAAGHRRVLEIGISNQHLLVDVWRQVEAILRPFPIAPE